MHHLQFVPDFRPPLDAYLCLSMQSQFGLFDETRCSAHILLAGCLNHRPDDCKASRR